MTCTRPGAVTQEDLIAYLDGEAPFEVAQHVRECADCAADARQYARAQQHLRHALHRFDCPSPQTLGDYHVDILPPHERVQIATHLLGCPRCAEELRTLRSFLADDSLGPAPSSAVRGLRRILATLRRPEPGHALGGLRGSADSGVQAYDAGEVAISLSLAPGARRGRSSLVGLLLREGADPETLVGLDVRLVDQSGMISSTEVDDLGNFVFEDVASGEYRLEIQLADQVVVVEDLRIGG